MGADSRGKEQNWYGNDGFNGSITEAKPEYHPEQYTAAAQRYALGGCLKPVIGVRQPDDTDATQQVEKDPDRNENQTDHITH
jgi:hypothetical protein